MPRDLFSPDRMEELAFLQLDYAEAAMDAVFAIYRHGALSRDAIRARAEAMRKADEIAAFLDLPHWND